MQAATTATGILLLITGVLMILLAALQGVLVGGAGLGFVLEVQGGGADPFALGALGAYGLIGIALLLCATVTGAIAVLAGYRALTGEPRMARAAGLLAVGVSGLFLATSCLSCPSVLWSLPLVLGLIAVGLAADLPRDAIARQR